MTDGTETEPRPELPETGTVTPVQSREPGSGGSRRLLRAGGATVAAALVGVGIGVGVIEVRYDDPLTVATAPTVTAPAPTPTPTTTPFGARSNGNHFGSLRDLLLPMPQGFEPGPDDGNYGNDAELTAEQLSAEFDDDLVPVPKDQQEKYRRLWEDLHVKATGVRTYRNQNLVLGITLHQFNQQEVQKMNEFTALFTGDTGLFRLGPAVPGHPEAHCYLLPAPPSAPLDRMECSAAQGDLLVVLSAEGTSPLPKDKIVALLTQQLDRLARPGASV
ncbi:hypothetical protein GCM10009639_54550 [Kitasatospora putterlickiae]|uniref:Secreted protein n=1 Tax=Kitasatospora putterlickiae TaxID=221725 RepID=A0ABN1YDX1_9ACTN